ncbi:hypothetical protein H6F96_08740 [Microcoleus sp. FACHB-53]|nr:hypothetical protein [Microcoleus sp. FACHB-53]MBD2129489.1 hypothetical protein [Microcoleus sp. FACHB-1]
MSNYFTCGVYQQQEHTQKKACLYNLLDGIFLSVIGIYLNRYVQEG